jgi:hypothetical protein
MTSLRYRGNVRLGANFETKFPLAKIPVARSVMPYCLRWALVGSRSGSTVATSRMSHPSSNIADDALRSGLSGSVVALRTRSLREAQLSPMDALTLLLITRCRRTSWLKHARLHHGPHGRLQGKGNKKVPTYFPSYYSGCKAVVTLSTPVHLVREPPLFPISNTTRACTAVTG